MPMARGVDQFRIARIDKKLIEDQFRLIQIHQQTPRFAGVRRCVDLPVERADIKPVFVFWVDGHVRDIAAVRANDLPMSQISRAQAVPFRPEYRRASQMEYRNCQ